MHTTDLFDQAKEVLADLGIEPSELPPPRPLHDRKSSLLLPCRSGDGREFLLKFFCPPQEGRYYPPEVRIDDYARREVAFYSFLDFYDAERRELPAPRVIMMDSKDPPRWLLLEHIPQAPGPRSEHLSADNVFELLRAVQRLPMDRLTGRRNFPLHRWDIASLRDRVVRLMYEPLIFVVGEELWKGIRRFYHDAMGWLETRPAVPVHGDFTEDNILVDPDGRPYIVDFERIGTGSPEHDFTWFWIHSRRSPEWKRDLFFRFVHGTVGSDRVRMEWSMRATAVYLACRRLRFGHLAHGEQDRYRGANLALLRAALHGGNEFFPVPV
ncbi:MAG: aminoglycoside phosphotransferase family protein [Planctomycetota bacterium]